MDVGTEDYKNNLNILIPPSNTGPVISDTEYTLVPALTQEQAKKVNEQTDSELQNIVYARNIVESLIYSGKSKLEDLKDINFPGTTIPLLTLFDSKSTFKPEEIPKYIDDLQASMEAIRLLREQDEKENSINPYDNKKLLRDYGADWLKQKIDEQKAIDAQRATLSAEQKKTP